VGSGVAGTADRIVTVPPDVRVASAPRPGRNVRGIIIDLDGTALEREPRLHPRTRDAIRATAARLPVIIATGRMYVSALPWARTLHIEQPLVCYDGAVVRAMPASDETLGAVLRAEPLPAQAAIRALRLARQHRWYCQVYADEVILCEGLGPESDLYSRVSGIPVRAVADTEPYVSAGTPKVLFVVTDDAENARCLGTLRDELDSSARVTQSRPEYIEVVNAAVNKAVAAEAVSERLGFTLADCLAIGDAPNDIEMLKAAGFAAAIATSPRDVLDHADVVCAPPEDGGVADVLEALRL
jgi:Cof subfamily protein (haloacid dehalogenase superfamily)